ncbi:MAG: tetratricopeptide repeat protein [Myxococcales bacterium]|jgi:hypothetical protein
MDDRGTQHRRWVALMERQDRGETLSAEERAFCERFAAEDPFAREESALLSELAQLDGPPTADTRTLVDGALRRLADQRDAAERAYESEALGALRERPRPSRAMWALGAAALAAVATALLMVSGRGGKESPPATEHGAPAARVELVYSSGEVSVDGHAATDVHELLDESSVVRVDEGEACVAMDPDIDLCLGAHSRMRFARTQSAWRRLDLLAGEVAVQLAEQPEGHRLSIVSDGVWSTAVGTAFTVRLDPESGVQTTVLDGKVRVGHGGGEEHLVAAHQRARVRNGEASVSAISRTDESPEWALLEPTGMWDSPMTASLRVSGAPSGAELRLDGEPLGRAPLSALIPVGAHRLEVVQHERPALRRELFAAAGQEIRIDLSQPAAAAAAAPQADGETPAEPADAEAPGAATRPLAENPEPDRPRQPSATEMLMQARQHMQQGRFEEAARRYRALRSAHPDSREARTVLVSLAQLDLRLGRPEAALRGLDRYLSRGRGALAEEARHTRIRALRTLGRPDAEAEAIRDFLRRHPESFHAAGLEQRLERLTR